MTELEPQSDDNMKSEKDLLLCMLIQSLAARIRDNLVRCAAIWEHQHLVIEIKPIGKIAVGYSSCFVS